MSKDKSSVVLLVSDELGTFEVARRIAERLRGESACIELVGDVGAGKTTFTQAFVKALGSSDVVTSPTFTLENIYHSDTNVIHHFDLYRLDSIGLIPQEVQEALNVENSIVIIEWANVLHENNTLPKSRIIITFEPEKHSERARRLTISAPEQICKVLENMKELST